MDAAHEALMPGLDHVDTMSIGSDDEEAMAAAILGLEDDDGW
jgi:hypothetical protein